MFGNSYSGTSNEIKFYIQEALGYSIPLASYSPLWLELNIVNPIWVKYYWDSARL